ncbi:hypothetical protein LINGRAPRIM_LOCUS380 [Linum grandiflorum]
MQFKVWASNTWGPNVGDIRELSDELWVCKCNSKLEVERIINLGRWEFKGRRILANAWIPIAGRSSVLGNGFVWIRVDGIPLHLRSYEYFNN